MIESLGECVLGVPGRSTKKSHEDNDDDDDYDYDKDIARRRVSVCGAINLVQSLVNFPRSH